MSSAHLDYEMLADLAEGLLDADKAASADAHLVACPECSERSAEIAEVSRLLAEAPIPAMPADLAGRIDAAIAAETPPVADFAAARSRRMSRRLQVLSAAAAATVMVGGGIAVTRAALDGAATPTASDAGSRPVQEPANSMAKKDTRGLSGGGDPSMSIGEMAFPVLHTGTDYHRSTLPAQVRSSLRTAAQGGDAAPRSQELLGCVGSISKGRAPMLVDTATFEGREATIVVLPVTGSYRLDVWIAGPNCSAAGPDLIDRTELAG